MEAASEGEDQRNNSDGIVEEPKKPRRQMKTPYQLEILEKTYASETYPSEATRAELSEKLGLSDRQLQMWFCHRRLKDKKEVGVKKPKAAAGRVGKRAPSDSARDGEVMVAEKGSNHGSRSRSGSGSGSGSGSASASGSDSGSGSGSGNFRFGGDMPMVRRYYESAQLQMERRVRACIEAQLGGPLREDGPILGTEFDEPPPGAFGASIAMAEQRNGSGQSYGGKLFDQFDFKPSKAVMGGPRECLLDESKIRSDAYARRILSNFYDSPVECYSANASLLLPSNGQPSRGYGVQGQVSSMSLSPQQGRQGYLSSPSGDKNNAAQRESMVNMQMDVPDSAHPVVGSENPDASDGHVRVEKKRKTDEARFGRLVEAHEKRIRKELEKQDILRRKREEQLKKEMEKQDRERRKEEERLMREKQRQQERFQREERRELERREKFLQKESLRAERRRQKEEIRREKEEARLKAALERATARKIAKESMELIEDERLELMELAVSSKGLSSIVSLDHDTLQNLESFRDRMCPFPPKSVQLKKPFAIQPWTDSEENIGNLLMVWRFCITFADVLGLWPFTLDEFVQAFHDYESRLLGEIHIALLRLIIKDIEDVVRTTSIGVGATQGSAANLEGGHPSIVEGAYLWGFDICSWKNHLNPLTWPEILRQFALSAGFGPQLKKKSIEQASMPDDDEAKGCEDVVSILRNGSAAENAVAIMQEKGFSLQRRPRHRLTPGTVKFAAYHILSLEGSTGLTVLELANKIQKSGLRDLTTSKTPEASISVALSRDTVLFERTAPSTYRVRPPFRKDPADAEAILAAAREKIKRYENGFSGGENVENVERDEDSDVEGAECPEVDEGIEGAEGPELDLDNPNANKNSGNYTEVSICMMGNEKEKFSEDIALNLQYEPNTAETPVNQYVDIGGDDNGASSHDQGETEIDESKSGEPWVQGLTEAEYSDLSVEERLNALVALVGIANEGNCVHAVLEERLDAANALKKQVWAEAQLDKKRIKEESLYKIHFSSFMGNEAEIKLNCSAPESRQNLVAVDDNKICESLLNPIVKEPFLGVEDTEDHLNILHSERSLVEPEASISQINPSSQQNGCATERSRLQLKSYISHRAEETYIYRSLPLGQDRRRNRYWQFVASASRHDPGSGRIFVESPGGYWRLIDSEEAFNALLASLDTRGIRESHLHIMLRNIEKSFKENVRRNCINSGGTEKGGNRGNEAADLDSSSSQSGGVDSPGSSVSGSNSNTLEASSSFRIELGKNETEKKVALERYQEFQKWMWKECFNSFTSCAMRHGKKRRRPLLEICDCCLDLYIVENDVCPSCCHPFHTFDDKRTVSEPMRHHEKKINSCIKNSNISGFSLPLRIRLLKALLTFIEVTLPPEAVQPSWMENCRIGWGMKLHASSSPQDLLQILTEFETVIKRDCISKSFETTEELLASCRPTGRVLCDSADPSSVTQLPWIPHTCSAVSLRLLELDHSICYTNQQKAELHDRQEVEDFTNLQARFALVNNIGRVEQSETARVTNTRLKKRKKLVRVQGTSRHRKANLHRVVHGSPKHRKAGRGSTCRKLQKIVSSSGGQDLKDKETLAQVLSQQGHRMHGRGRRTIRRRRIEKSDSQARLPDHLENMGGLNDSGVSSRNPGGEEWVGEEIQRTQIEDVDNSSSESVESDDDTNLAGYSFGKWRMGNSTIMSDEDADGGECNNGFRDSNSINPVVMSDEEEDGDEDNNGFEEMGEENFEANIDSEGTGDETSGTGDSEDDSG
ncbi:hypothetical protein NMG60_11012770 [Bertholletia excelsa]